jgi:prepilin peptidase dependent protein B
MLILLKNQHGTSLVELMISMTLGLASITAMASLVGHGIGLNARLLATSRLEEEINAVVAVISHDLKRAGYYALTIDMLKNPSTFSNSSSSTPSSTSSSTSSGTSSSVSSNPFDGSLIVGTYSSESANSCINFAYDRNKNGVLDTSSSNEKFGFRLRNRAVEIRLKGATCEQSGWHDLTDPAVVEITALEFIVTQNTVQQVVQTQVHIMLQARLKKRPNISRSINTDVLIENYE